MGVGWAVFRNYAGHAKEILGDVTDYPRFFLMPPSAMVEATEAGNENFGHESHGSPGVLPDAPLRDGRGD